MEQLGLFATVTDEVCAVDDCGIILRSNSRRQFPMCARHSHAERERRWRAENVDESRRRSRQNHDAHRTERRATSKQYAERNSEQIREYQTAYRRKNRSKSVAYFREYNRTHAEVRKAANVRWRKENAESLARKKREYAQSDRGRLLMRLNRARRRARLAGAPGNHTNQQVEWRMQMWGWKCWMCGAEANSVDHVIPISKGGSNWPANLRPACVSCNAAKGARSWRLFIRERN